ncbi:MAG: T9SS type A sorting domain-containing protein [Bacteroidota bacterium]
MKTLLLLLTLSISYSLFAQSYRPYILPNKTWDIQDTEGNDICFGTKYRRMLLDRDTLIDGERWFFIATRKTKESTCANDTLTADVFVGHTIIREDTAARRVWWRDLSTTNGGPFPILDFAAQIGDTVRLGATQIEEGILQDIQPYTLLNGEVTREFFFDTNNGPTSIIEGVGGGFNLFDPFLVGLGFASTTICVKENDNPIYSEAPDGLSCFLKTVDSDAPSRVLMEVYPNPTNHKMTVRYNIPLAEVTIWSVVGEKLYESAESSSFEVDLSPYPAGVYLLQVQSMNGKLKQIRRIVKY